MGKFKINDHRNVFGLEPKDRVIHLANMRPGLSFAMICSAMKNRKRNDVKKVVENLVNDGTLKFVDSGRTLKFYLAKDEPKWADK